MTERSPRTLRELVRRGAREFERHGLFFGHGTDNAQDEALHLATWALKLPFDVSEDRLDARLTQRSRAAVMQLYRARIRTRKPAAYLTGEGWFAGLAFHVDERVIVPRSPIAELIGARFRPWLVRDPRAILDLCSGSGCIAVACAKAFPSARVDAVELEEPALQVLARNVARHRVGRRVRGVCSDLFEKVRDRRYDLIVSNPPYVPSARLARMPAEFRYEPERSLAAGRDGLAIVDRILREAPRHLKRNGMLACEVGGSQRRFVKRYPDLPVVWPEFEHGGDGVFIIARDDLVRWNEKNVR